MLGYGGRALELDQAAHVHLRGATLQGQRSSLPFVPSWICSVPPVPLHVCQGGGCPCACVMALHMCWDGSPYVLGWLSTPVTGASTCMLVMALCVR